MPSLANVQRAIAAGFQRLDFHVTDSKGLPAGITGSVTPGANGVAAGRINAVKTMNVNIPAAVGVPVTGDDVLQGTFMFPNDTPRTFDIGFAEEDFADRQAFQGIIPRNFGNMTFSGRDISPFVLNNCILIGVSRASAKTAGVSGLPMYSGIIASRSQITVRGRNTFAERAAAEFLGTVNLNAADGYPWGITFQNSVEGYTNSFIEDWTEQYPITMHRWTQTGAITTFNLGETPASTSLSDILVFVIDTNGLCVGNGPQTSGVTINATNKTITFSVAPTTGFDIVCVYGYVPS